MYARKIEPPPPWAPVEGEGDDGYYWRPTTSGRDVMQLQAVRLAIERDVRYQQGRPPDSRAAYIGDTWCWTAKGMDPELTAEAPHDPGSLDLVLGLTLRRYYAACAMMGLLANPDLGKALQSQRPGKEPEDQRDFIARLAWSMADRLEKAEPEPKR